MPRHRKTQDVRRITITLTAADMKLLDRLPKVVHCSKLQAIRLAIRELYTAKCAEFFAKEPAQ